MLIYIYIRAAFVTMTDFTENATPPKSTKSRISNSSVQIQIKQKSQFECVPRNNEKSEFLDLGVDFGDVVFSEETMILVIRSLLYICRCKASQCACV